MIDVINQLPLILYILSFIEFMSGGSMYDFLRQNGAMPLQSLLRVAIDVTEGMNYLHQNNIVHRDLKAANLLINQHGVRFSLVLFSFCMPFILKSNMLCFFLYLLSFVLWY